MVNMFLYSTLRRKNNSGRHLCISQHSNALC